MTEENGFYVLGYYKKFKFGGGFQVLYKYYTDYSGSWTYSYGDAFKYPQPDLEWNLTELNLEWNDISKPKPLTRWQRFKKKLGIPVDIEFVDVRPENKSVVICGYNIYTNPESEKTYEVVEYNNRTWKTDFSRPFIPSEFAYIPEKIRYEVADFLSLNEKKKDSKK